MGKIGRIEAVLGVLIVVALVTGGAYWGFQSHGLWFGVSVLVMLPLAFLLVPLQQALERRGLGWLRWPLILVWVLWFVWLESVMRGWSWASLWAGLQDPSLAWGALPTWDSHFFDDPSVRAYIGLCASFLALYAVMYGSLWRTLTGFAAFGLWLYSTYQLADIVRANQVERCAQEHRLAGPVVPQVVVAAVQACPSGALPPRRL
jgi:hypothetical protein